jgi:hypothetical protein
MPDLIGEGYFRYVEHLVPRPLPARPRNSTWRQAREWSFFIEIIDIECVLLSFLSKNFVSTKWRIYKGILASSRLLWWVISRVCRECELFFSTKFEKKQLYRDWKWKKFFKGENPIPVGFWTEYIQKSSFENTFSTLKPKHNTTNKDKLNL